MGRHRPNLSPILKNPDAPWRQLAVIVAMAPIEKTNLIFIMALFSSESARLSSQSVRDTERSQASVSCQKLFRDVDLGF